MGGGLFDRILAAFRPKSPLIHDLPDRRLLREAFLPALAKGGGRVLFVGVRRYTASYYAILEKHDGEVWTTDIVDKVARFGRRGRHRTGDVCDADQLFAGMIFDTIVCNGVLGYGVDAEAQQRKTLEALSRILKPGGRLLLGWNTDKIGDPLSLAAPWFTAAPLADLPARTTFDGVTHIYDSLVRRQKEA
ncbi:MAG: class I SAM-dependent methyltransferase [Asticcacaulis sp.]|nr:class I SAM-dependent methyltransferase [Asticcacaulis sp.]